MFLVESPVVAILLCIVTMLCWGSWANTQKMVKWRFEYFYWDYVLGIVGMSLLMALTFGNTGDPAGWGFWSNLGQATVPNVLSAFVGGIVFNAANILLVAAIAIAGISVAFPVGIGLALVLGVLVNYMANQQGNPTLLFIGVLFVTAAIVLNALAYRARTSQSSDGEGDANRAIKKGLIVSVAAGVLMAFFYYFVAASMPGSFDGLKEFGGKLSPYTATFIFALGVLASNFWFNPYIMKHPFQGDVVAPDGYWKGTGNDHLWGLLGGAIWCIGTSVNVIASTKASPAIAYGLGQGATLVSALWGVFIWKEFQGCGKKTEKMLIAMFGTFVIGLALIMAAKSGDASAPAAVDTAIDVQAEPTNSGPMGQPMGQNGPGMRRPGERPMGGPGMGGQPGGAVMMGGPNDGMMGGPSDRPMRGPNGMGEPNGMLNGGPKGGFSMPAPVPSTPLLSTPAQPVPVTQEPTTSTSATDDLIRSLSAPVSPTPTVSELTTTEPTISTQPIILSPSPIDPSPNLGTESAPSPIDPSPNTGLESAPSPGAANIPMADPAVPAEEPAAEMPKDDAGPAPLPNENEAENLSLTGTL